jgi:hypothetical protein
MEHQKVFMEFHKKKNSKARKTAIEIKKHLEQKIKKEQNEVDKKNRKRI